MRVLGIDQSTKNVGWGLLEYSVVDRKRVTKYLCHGFIPRPKGLEYPETIRYMVNRLRDVLAEYTPDYIAIEAPKDNRGFKATQILTELIGAIKYTMMEARYSFIEIPPSSMKKIVTGYGWSSKEEVAVEAARQLGLNYEDIVPAELYKSGAKKGQVKEYILDGSDALGLALAFLDYLKQKDSKLDYEAGR